MNKYYPHMSTIINAANEHSQMSTNKFDSFFAGAIWMMSKIAIENARECDYAKDVNEAGKFDFATMQDILTYGDKRGYLAVWERDYWRAQQNAPDPECYYVWYESYDKKTDATVKFYYQSGKPGSDVFTPDRSYARRMTIDAASNLCAEFNAARAMNSTRQYHFGEFTNAPETKACSD